MEIYFLIGIYGSGKSTILQNINSNKLNKISLDILDIESREKEDRIKIIYNLFLKFSAIDINFESFKSDYLKIFFIQNKSLINTLSSLYSKYSMKTVNENLLNELREKILIPSILEYFLNKVDIIKGKKYLIDTGAMHFYGMDEIFFKRLNKIFQKINLIYINNPPQQIFFNLFCKNNNHFAFLERGFKKEIFKAVEKKFKFKTLLDIDEFTKIIESNSDIKFFIEDYIKKIILFSKSKIEDYIKFLENLKNIVSLIEINLNINEKLNNIIERITCIIKVKKNYNMENKLLEEKPKVIFFDLSSTILDSHKIDLECINAVLEKYGMPTWEKGTRLKKDKNKSMKENFSNFFGVDNAEQAYQKYLELLLTNIDKMPLIENIEQTLKYCKENEIKAVIVSNRDNVFVEKFLDIFNFRKYFDFILTPEIAGCTKPDPNIIKPYLDKNSLDPKTDTMLFVGDSFADIRCAFKSGCIPVLYTEIVRDEISSRNLERLSKINPDNPIRFISTQKDFVGLLEKSKVNWEEKLGKKITYIGAGGKIGRQAIGMICSQVPDDENVNVVLIGSGTNDSLVRLNGFTKDIIGSLELKGKKHNIRFTITNDYSETVNSDIVICSAAKWPSKEDQKRFEVQDPSGRNVQSLANAEMIAEIANNLNKYCPQTLFLITTNQVDMMCHIARQYAKKMNVIGLTGGVDSSRLRQNIKDIIGLSSDGLMIGYHNSTMVPLLRSLRTLDGENIFPIMSGVENFEDDLDLQEEFMEMEKIKLETIVSATKTMGGEISKQQKAGLISTIDTGASILPATAIARLVSDYCFGVGAHIESYNVFISNSEIAHHYGIQPNTELSIPLQIEKGKIKQITEIPILETEKLEIKRAQEDFDRQINEIFGIKEGQKL